MTDESTTTPVLDETGQFEIDKHMVTMKSTFIAGQTVDEDGNTVDLIATHEATDYIRPDILDAYVTDMRTKWQSVIVSDEPDAGPGGYHGATHVPEYLNHPLAGQTFEATYEQHGLTDPTASDSAPAESAAVTDTKEA